LAIIYHPPATLLGVKICSHARVIMKLDACMCAAVRGYKIVLSEIELYFRSLCHTRPSPPAMSPLRTISMSLSAPQSILFKAAHMRPHLVLVDSRSFANCDGTRDTKLMATIFRPTIMCTT
jgi:hypothetical protein